MRRRDASFIALAAALVLAACGQPTSSRSAASAATLTSPEPVHALPDANRLLPEGVVGATPWIEMTSMPNDFDPHSLHGSLADLADAFGAAIHAAWDRGPERPDLALTVFEETSERAILIISETGFGDDSVAGAQYALLARADGARWRVVTLWSRALCRRGVSGDLCV